MLKVVFSMQSMEGKPKIVETRVLERYIPTKEELESVCKIPQRVANKFHFYDPEELESVANLALAKAIVKYRSDSTMPFNKWIVWYCITRVKAYLKSYHYSKILMTLSITDKEGVLRSRDSELEIDKIANIELGKKLLSKIHGKDKEIVVLYLSGTSYKEIATKLHLEPITVRQKYSRIIHNLRVRLGKVKGRCITKWVECHPKIAKKVFERAQRNGVQSNKKLNNKERRILGWRELPLYQCKMLHRLSDKRERTLYDIRTENDMNNKYCANVLSILRKLGFVDSRPIKGNKLVYWITEKALQERKPY